MATTTAAGLFDAHCHLQRCSAEHLGQIVDHCRLAGVCGVCVCATSEADWEDVSRLHSRFPAYVRPCYGVHPFFAAQVSDAWKDRLDEVLLQNPTAMVGEIGLDKSRAGLAKAPLSVQLPVFQHQLAAAARLQRAVHIHCVSAYGPMLDACRAHTPPRLLLHSFAGSPDTMAAFLRLGAYFSFSAAVLNPNFRKAREIVRHVPCDRLLVETDYPDQAPPPGSLADAQCTGQAPPAADARAARRHSPATTLLVVRELARLRDEPESTTREACWRNACTFFGLA